MLKLVLIALTVCAVANAATFKNDAATTDSMRADAGKWVDEIFANVRNEAITQGLHQVSVPSFSHTFSKKFFLITYHGTMYFSNMYFTGIETLHRTGVADITTEANGDLVISLDAAISPSTVGTYFQAQIYLLNADGHVRGTFSNLRAFVKIRVGSDLRPKLEDVLVKDLGYLSNVDVSGLGFTGIYDFMAEMLSGLFDGAIIREAEKALQGKLRPIIVKKVNEAIFPGAKYLVDN